MKRLHIQTKTMQAQDVYDNWDELYDEISSEWRAKSKRMQLRRWHKLRHAHQVG